MVRQTLVGTVDQSSPVGVQPIGSGDILSNFASLDVTPTDSKDFASLTAPKTGLHGGAIPGPS